MTTKKADNSAARNNRSQHLPNDVPDSELVARVFSTAGGADQVDVLLDQLRGVHIAVQVKNALALAEASPATWQTFISHVFWKTHLKQRPDVHDQLSAPRFVFRIYFSEKGSGAKRASELWTAVQQLLHEKFTHAQVLAEFSKGLGKDGMDLKAVCRRAAERNRRSKPAEDSPAKAKAVAKPLPAARKTKKTAVATDSSPSTQSPAPLPKSSAGASVMDSLRLYFPDGMGDFARIQKGEVVVVTMKNLGFASGGYTAEFIKQKSKKPK